MKEADQYRVKYEQDGMARAEELEMAKLKLQARLAENLNTIEQLQVKTLVIILYRSLNNVFRVS